MSEGIYQLQASVSSQVIADKIGLSHQGPAVAISAVSNARSVRAGALAFGTPQSSASEGSIWIADPKDVLVYRPATLLVSEHPRLDFIRALYALRELGVLPASQDTIIDQSAEIHPTAIIETGAHIGAMCRIGENTVIRGSARLESNVTVGVSTTIGHDGFGYARESNGTPIHFPHLGFVRVGTGAVIGNLCSVSRGTLEDTVVGEETKIDDLSYIAHNVKIGRRTLIMSGVRLNGRSTIGEACWIGTGALVREGVTIGNGATIGMGAVVLHSVVDGAVVAGNPAIPIR